MEYDLNLYEVMDRAACLLNQLGETITEHDAVKEHPELASLVKKAEEALMALYQTSSSVLSKSGKDPRLLVEETTEEISLDCEANRTEGCGDCE